MADKLSIFNSALRLCKERKLASLSENREPRRLLDDAWGDGSTHGAVKACLEMGQWTFAMRTAMVDYSPSVSPSFGYAYAFDQPADMVRVSAVCRDEYFKEPLLDYTSERGYWYAPIETIFVKWVSNDQDYGADLSLWPESFVNVVEAYLATEIVGNLTQSSSGLIDRCEKALKTALTQARGNDMMNQPTRFMPKGSWISSRMRGTTSCGAISSGGAGGTSTPTPTPTPTPSPTPSPTPTPTPGSPPVISTGASQSVDENAVLAVSLTANVTIDTWAIVGGADQARFEISGTTLRWLSNGTKDYEAPDDADTDNVYVVIVRATSDDGSTDKTISVTVNDVAPGSEGGGSSPLINIAPYMETGFI